MPLTARFAGTCRSCGRPIAVGEEITDTGRTTGLRWAHAGCTSQDLFDLDGAPPQHTPDAGTPVADLLGAHPTDPDAPALEVWTDGACSGNPGPGGWAWATRDGRQGSGGAPHTTNQRMEIQAALAAVTTLTERPVVVVSDSTYVVNCFRNDWWRGWLAKGWVNSQKKPVANRELWEPLIAAYRGGGIGFRWVKGHSGDVMNDLVDQLAVAAGQQQRG